MGLAGALSHMGRDKPAVSRATRAQEHFVLGEHKKRKLSDWTAADLAAFRRQLAQHQGWDPGPGNARREYALAAKLMEREGGVRRAAGLILAACCGDELGVEKPRDLTWLLGEHEYAARVRALREPLGEAARAQLPEVAAAIFSKEPG